MSLHCWAVGTADPLGRLGFWDSLAPRASVSAPSFFPLLFSHKLSDFQALTRARMVFADPWVCPLCRPRVILVSMLPRVWTSAAPGEKAGGGGVSLLRLDDQQCLVSRGPGTTLLWVAAACSADVLWVLISLSNVFLEKQIL